MRNLTDRLSTRLPKNSTLTAVVGCNQLLEGASEMDFKSYVFGQAGALPRARSAAILEVSPIFLR
jgi:hypothetical protein